MKTNVEWHKSHPMPENPTLDERIQWHLEHARQCACREIPKTIMKEITSRNKKVT